MTETPRQLTDPPDSAQIAPPAELLSEILLRVRLSGAIFLRGEYTAPWAFESAEPIEVRQMLRPEAERLILFHLVAAGACVVKLRSGQQVEAVAGEVIVLPYGDHHIMGSALEVVPVHISKLLEPPPWRTLPVIRHGGGGHPSSIVCGYLHCDDLILDPVIRALPPIFTVRPTPGPAATWLEASIQYALDASARSMPSTSPATLRLPELLFQEVLLQYVQSARPELGGWLTAMHDPIVGPALVALHAAPSHPWTATELARHCACSRSTLTERFVRTLGRPPISYLAEWRMRLAGNLLRETTLGVAAVARRVGYESEEAFTRAFRRGMGTSPSQWRQRRVVL